MNDVEAALGITQIKKLNNFINSRRKIFNLYSKILKNLPIILPSNSKNCISSNHLYVIRVDNNKTNKKRNDLFNFLRKEKIFVNIHYIPIYRQPYFSRIGFSKKKFLIVKNIIAIVYLSQFTQVYNELKFLKLKNF